MLSLLFRRFWERFCETLLSLLPTQRFLSEEMDNFEQRLRPYLHNSRLYEDRDYQEGARRTVPEGELEEKALISLAKEGNFEPSKGEFDHAFLIQLLLWFKKSFSWVDRPPCDGCGKETMHQGMGDPLPSETRFGASRVELYRCMFCSRMNRFPRYNDPLKLVETRKGRCGEWANCFTLYCRAYGYPSRLVLDFTDHIWTECFSPCLGRWMHLDPCEAVYDKPLLYEKGWNKKLNYIIAIAIDGVYDVTKRYTRKWNEVLTRRNIITEPGLLSVITKITTECRREISSQELNAFRNRDAEERQQIEKDLRSTDEPGISLPGRQSGDEAWRVSRSEFASGGNGSLSFSSCPVRLCVDEHVTRVYSAFLPLLSHFVKAEVSLTEALEVLGILKAILTDLHKSPFKSRQALLDFSRSFVHLFLPYVDDLLDALSPSKKVEIDGRVEFLRDRKTNAVRLSLALPVALDALEEMITSLTKRENLGADLLFYPLLKLNRVHSGTVVASGEEIPFGISTAAFDGCRSTKWEEPKGARGSWFIYKLSGGQKRKLVAYEFMSANDVPERDPMNWVLEGSDNGGDTWRVLDEQTSQMFDKRFQRRTYEIRSSCSPSNVFRFRFLAVRDSRSNPRLQIGGIDLFCEPID